MNERRRILRPRLDQADTVVFIFRQPVGEDAAGGTRPNNDIVVSVIHDEYQQFCYIAADTAISDRRWKRSMFGARSITPVDKATKVISSSGSTQNSVAPKP